MFHADGWMDGWMDRQMVAFAILRRRLTPEGNLYYWIVRFFHIKEQSPQYTNPVAYRGGGLGCSNPPPRNSEDIGEVLDRVRKKNRRLDFLL